MLKTLPVKQPAKYEAYSAVGCETTYSRVYTTNSSSITAAALMNKPQQVSMFMILNCAVPWLMYSFWVHTVIFSSP
jgi:hypothetical protein